jgi:hypothetical protein
MIEALRFVLGMADVIIGAGMAALIVSCLDKMNFEDLIIYIGIIFLSFGSGILLLS